MTMNNEMPVPEWVGEARQQMYDSHGKVDYSKGEVKKRDLPVVDTFSNIFAEYELRENDLLVHVFPRGGGEDRYWPCEYKDDGTYVPSRLEEIVESVTFPDNIVELIKAAADKVWQGDVSIDLATLLRYDSLADVAEEDPVEVDLRAYSVQFQSAATTVKLVGVPKFMDQFCEALDEQLE